MNIGASTDDYAGVNISEKCRSFVDKLSIVDKVSRALGAVASWMLLLCALAIGYEILARYVFKSPTIWAFESSIMLFIAYTFLTMAKLQEQKRHIVVDIVINEFGPTTKRVWELVTLSLSLLFSIILFIYSAYFSIESIKLHEVGPSFWAPVIWPVKLSLTIGSLILSIQYIKDIIKYFIIAKYSNRSSDGRGILNNTKLIFTIFILLIAISIFMFTKLPILAFVMLMLTLLMFGVPIYAALGLVGAAGMYFVFGGQNQLFVIPQVTYGAMDNFALVCIPLFVLCGELLNRAGAGKELYEMAAKFCGNLQGGALIATIVACAAFAAISASSVATALTIGVIALPALNAYNYDKRISYGTLAAGGTLGIMIPPSGSMIVYSAVTEESLGKLFIAGVIPGIIMAILFSVYAFIYQRYFSINTITDVARKYSWKEKINSLMNAKWALLTPVIILGGIYGGLFTALEAAAVAVIYAIVMLIARRKMRYSEFPRVLADCAGSAATILVIICGALIMGYYMTMLNLPNLVINAVITAGFSRWTVIVILMLAFIVMGMFLEVVSIMLITLPIVYPLIIKLGFDGIWFAVLMIVNMELALITPPVGLNLFVIQGIEKANLSTILSGVWPYFFLMVISMIIVAVFPELSLWLPNLMLGK